MAAAAATACSLSPPITLSPSLAPRFTCSSSLATQPDSAKKRLLSLIADQDRGLRTQRSPGALSSIVEAIEAVATLGSGTVTTGASLSATWRLLWTTEKEQLYIIENARWFGTAAGDVLQVIDVEKKALNNVITFPPDGVFFVRSNIEIASSQRVNFRYDPVSSLLPLPLSAVSVISSVRDAEAQFVEKLLIMRKP